MCAESATTNTENTLQFIQPIGLNDWDMTEKRPYRGSVVLAKNKNTPSEIV